jgi:hypothetical protein
MSYQNQIAFFGQKITPITCLAANNRGLQKVLHRKKEKNVYKSNVCCLG